MKFKIVNRHVIISLIGSVIWLITNAASNNRIDYFFPKRLDSLTIKSKLKIVLVRNIDGFELPLDECLKKFHNGILGVKTYELEDRVKKNKIAVSEYIFKDTTAARYAFRLVYPYAESVRKTCLKDWNTLCFNIPIPQVYYASLDGLHIYLYTTSYKFSYRSKEDSPDMQMQCDKRILLDDLYRQMIRNK